MFLGNYSDNLSVYIADDSPVLRQSLNELLSEIQNVNVVGEAGDGKTAQQEILEIEPDVVLLDIRMPGKNGIEVLRHIKKVFPEIVVIMFTSHDHSSYRTASYESGADYYYHKTTGLLDLVETLETMAASSADRKAG